MNKQKQSIAEDCGRFFENGFNIGILTYIRQHEKQFAHHLDQLYVNDLRELHFPEMAKNSFKRHKFTIDENKRKIARQWFLFFLQKGFLAGLNFFAEYIEALPWSADEGPIEITYYQCSFCGENSLYTNHKTNEQEWGEILAQLAHYHIDPSSIPLQQHQRAGRFLKADTLLLLRLGDTWRMLCIDLSIFSVTTDENLRDPNDAQVLRELLIRDLSYMRSKSVFANLSIDTASGSPDFTFSKGLNTYFTAFKHDDKESAKLIQAGSYAFDFYMFLKERQLFTDTSNITFNIVGYTDRGINAMTCTQQNMNVLATCAHIYQHDIGAETIHQARLEVLETIRSNAARSFENGENFTNAVMSVVTNHEDGVHWVTPDYQEHIDNFVNSSDPFVLSSLSDDIKERLAASLNPLSTLDLRQAHQNLIMQELDASSNTTFLFLTGNPGIGKTTAITKFLEQHRNEGFLFLYVSPRTQVNLDIVNKFRDKKTKILQGDTFALTSNSVVIQENQGKPTVHYYAAQRRGDFIRQGLKDPVTFIDAHQLENERPKRHTHRLSQLSEERIWDHGETSSGVLNSVCNALYISLREQLSRQLIATAAIQSLKKLGHGKDAHNTLTHLKKIFRMATKGNRVLPAEMQKLAQEIKHIFIMIDEVTGDESGVAFLDGIRKFVKDYELTQHGFNTKVIIADASIVDHDVIKQHIQDGANEYEPDKIFFRNVTSSDTVAPLSRFEFPFYKKQSVCINANSYPAKSLSLSYRICFEFMKYDEEAMLHAKERLIEQIQQRMIEDIDTLLQRQDVPQIIVYIQDKKRLAQLIEGLRQRYGHFEKKVHYLSIHANISDKDKKEVDDFKEKVRVIFMTASASRGLSFPLATHILVDIPRFEVEQNLMEIIQVIYRGRGDEMIEQKEKELLFYLSDRAVYYDDSMREISLRESVLNVFNVLLILKTAIMTRIVGYGQVGRQKLMIIPIGGKSVLAAGETYIGVLERLITEVRKEYMRNYDRPWLKDVYKSLRELLGQADFRLSTSKEDRESSEHEQTTTYLSMLRTFTARFTDAVYNGLHRLLTWEPMELGYLAGGLLIVSAGQKQLQERYVMQLEDKLRKVRESSLYKRMQHINLSEDYPDSLRNAMYKALELIDLLNNASPEKTQHFTQDSRNPDQYYAIPLLAFLQENILKEYFSRSPEEPEEASFRWLLAAYTRTFYPITSALPIGDEYDEFPFLLFRSFNLKEIRKRIFSDTHLLISNEMNVLNMLLSYRD
ncbi:helicase-related protein [Ktedonobacter robiniae]|uniref:Helicase C-terminal domain-containing protein n=1 Tax=Ktedonobacter robiniae TaxID=2778365 RepID=A0ABQ3V3E3_9CHLR|nr:helicase-related protein [Ktedonobacter robiniae]GHO59282.1 hypothetical protein KSB_77570 [Ktedonobacter robiniae]